MRGFELDQTYLKNSAYAFIPDNGHEGSEEFVPDTLNSVEDESSALQREIDELKKKLEVEKEIAFKEGFEKAAAEYEEKLAAATREIAERLTTIIDDLQLQFQEFKKQVEDLAARCSIELAEALLLHAIRFKPEYIVRFMREVVEIQKQAKIVSIRVSPEDYELLSLINLKKTKSFEGIELIADETIRAGCILETVSGDVSMLPLDRLSELRESVFE